MNQIKIFPNQIYLKNFLFQDYNIKKIDLCYKINEIISLQKDIEELDEKIERIEFDESMIKKNEKKGVGGDKRFYYDCCLLCEESLEQIRKKRILKETKMNDLKELSKENTIENFCVAAFITFNTIKDQEDFLYKNNQNCCSRLIDAFINLFTIYFYCLCPYCCCCCCCFCCCRVVIKVNIKIL